jgi:thioredoxin reductase (NADPH)
VRIVGHRWSAASHQLKDFLGRNQVPYQWLDVEVSEEARAVVEAAGHSAGLPLVVLPDGGVMQAPSIAQVAVRIGMSKRPSSPTTTWWSWGRARPGLPRPCTGPRKGCTRCWSRPKLRGNVRHGSIKRVASAVGEGSVAVMFIHRYLSEP